MTSAWKEPSGRDGGPDDPGQDPGEKAHGEAQSGDNQLDLFEILPRARTRASQPFAAGHSDAGGRLVEVIEIEPRPGDGGRLDSAAEIMAADQIEVIGPAQRDYLDLGVSDADDLHRLEESIRWLMNAGATPPPRHTPLPPVIGLAPIDPQNDDSLLLDPDTLFTPRPPRRSGTVAAGAAKILLVSAIAAPTAYFAASWLQFPGPELPDPAPVAAAATPVAVTGDQVAAVAPAVAPAATPPAPAATPAAHDVDDAAQAPPPEPADVPPAAAASQAAEAVVAAVATEAKAAPEPPSAVPVVVAAVGPPSDAVTPVVAVAPTVASPAPAAVPPPKPALRQAEIAMMIERGRVLFEAGDLAAARLFFRRAANAGDASAAFAMGATYDPEILAQRFIRGIEADAAEAQRWYERGREIGADHTHGDMLAQGR